MTANALSDQSNPPAKSLLGTAPITVHRYRAFSLEIESQLSLPELKSSDAAPDVAIRFGEVTYPGAEVSADRWMSANDNGVHLIWEKTGSFLMRRGAEIVVDPVEGADESLLRSGILGPGLATILQQRGHLVLHASAVIIGERAFAFVGWKGRGKSTTAAALFARGHLLLTDDLLALKGDEGQSVFAHPGFPQFKLWPDSAESSLGESADSLPRFMDGYEKRVRPVSSGFAQAPRPLGAIYVLALGSELAMHRLPPQETFTHIVSNTFCARYGNNAFEGRTGMVHLRNVSRVASNVPVFRLERPSSLLSLSALADFVARHALSL